MSWPIRRALLAETPTIFAAGGLVFLLENDRCFNAKAGQQNLTVAAGQRVKFDG